jgi:hypothetical protein
MKSERTLFRAACLLVLTGGLAVSQSACGDEATDRAIAALRSVETEGSGFEGAIPAATQLRELPSEKIPLLLDGMEGVNPIAENWIRGVVFDLARKTDQPPLAALRKYAMDRSRNPIGRGLAMELISQRAADEADKLIAKCMDDPSLPLREMAVEQAIGQAKQRAKSKDNEAAKRRYREALTAARHPRQLSRIIEALAELGDEVKPAEVFSMITRWNSIAPFDNVDGIGFDAVYPPESQFLESRAVELSATYRGKTDRVGWQEVQASEEGVVDLAAAYNKEKGAICYLHAEFESPQNMPAEARLGCINANKVWINGREVMANKVYHSGSMIDQYLADFELKKGTNRILLKICQNEQNEPWAQDWKFQFRITDRNGKALRSTK